MGRRDRLELMKTVVEITPENIHKLLERYRCMFFYGNVMNRPEFKEMLDEDQRKAVEKVMAWAGDAHMELFTLGLKMKRGEKE